jgi:hypothetical protein
MVEVEVVSTTVPRILTRNWRGVVEWESVIYAVNSIVICLELLTDGRAVLYINCFRVMKSRVLLWGMARIWACADPPRNHLADITHSDSLCTLEAFHKILTKLKYSTSIKK